MSTPAIASPSSSAKPINYTPAKTVKEFIKHYTPGALFMDWIVGPIGGGKTTGMFMKLVYMAKLQAPGPDGWKRTRAVIVRNTAPQLSDTTIKSWSLWFPDGPAGKWKATTKDFILRFMDGKHPVECEVLFRPLDTPDDVNRVLSLEVTFALIDEFVQIPMAIIDALGGRCGRYPNMMMGGPTNFGVWGASNTSNEANHWYPYLEDRSLLQADVTPPDNWTYFKQPSGRGPDAENIENLPNGYYEGQMKGKTEAWIRQFIDVEWIESQAGRPVFPMFKKELHVSKKPLRWDKTLPLLAGYDPGMRCGFVLGQYDPEVGQVRILRAWALEDYATDRLIEDKIKPMLFQYYRGAALEMIPDPSSVNSSQSRQGSSVISELRKHFKVHYISDNTIDSRLQPAQYFMSRLTEQGAALLIDPACTDLIRALSGGYQWTVSKDDVQREVPLKNKASNIADGFTYLIRYIYRGTTAAGRQKQQPARQRRVANSYAMT